MVLLFNGADAYRVAALVTTKGPCPPASHNSKDPYIYELNGMMIVRLQAGMASWVSSAAFSAIIDNMFFKTTRKALLQMDGAPGHCDAANLKKVSLSNQVVSMGQGETSSIMQANDRHINKAVKQHLQELQYEWLKSEVLGAHQSGDPHRVVRNPALEVVADWAHKAVARVDKQVVTKSFTDVGLTLAVDGSQDSKLHSQLAEMLTLHSSNVTKDPTTWSNKDDGYQPGASTDQYVKKIKKRKKESSFKGRSFICEECQKEYANKYSKAAKEHAAACPNKDVGLLDWQPKLRRNVLKCAFIKPAKR